MKKEHFQFKPAKFIDPSRLSNNYWQEYNVSICQERQQAPEPTFDSTLEVNDTIETHGSNNKTAMLLQH